MKKILSVFMSIIICAVSLSPITSAYAADDYATELKNKGFPDTYIDSLIILHEKYPNWEFEVFDTGLDWQDAVDGERSPHDKQLIEKVLSSKYYCSCSKCMVNGSYVIQEGSTWVSASEQAVKYYMDPRTSLDEQYIFQFESTSYDGSQTISGIEGIIKDTWMHNAYITYLDADGVKQTYVNEEGSKVKYSTAIMQAAKASGMSAYYIASKIVQESGTTGNAGGVSGKYNSTYAGIYNFYNIGANTGVADGLKWASTSTEKNTTTANVNCRNKPTTKSSEVLVTIPYGTLVTINSETQKQSDGYVWYNVTATVDGKEYTGYVRSDYVNTTVDKYNRPWSNPYLSIVNGAKWIAEGFSKHQNTGYLQKFNVNKESGSLHSHEYMANVRGASSEAKKTYNAYVNAGTISSKKVFYIPVFDNMPKEVCSMTNSTTSGNSSGSSTSSTTTTQVQKTAQVTGLTLTGTKETSLSYKWTAVSGATKYYIHITNNTKGTTFSKTVTTNSASLNGLTLGNSYTVKVRAYSSKGWGAYSSTHTAKTAKPTTAKVTGLKNTAKTTTTLSYSWTKVSGATKYYIYIKNNTKGTTFSKTVTTNSAKLSGLTSGNSYTIKVKAYTSAYGWGAYSSTHTAKTTTPATAKVTGLKNTAKTTTTLSYSWTKVSNATKYYVHITNNKTGATYNKTVTTNSTKISGLTKGVSYSVKVRAYTKKYGWGAYSTAVKATTSASTTTAKVTGLKNTARTTTTLSYSWTKVSGATKYYIYIKNNTKGTTFSKTVTTNSAKLNGLTKGNSYTIKVRAYSSKGWGAYSSTITNKTKS